MLMTTIDGLFVAAARRAPARTFAHFVGAGPARRVRYDEAALRLAAEVTALREAGFRPGDTVACYTNDTEECLWFMLACAALGVVLAPIGPHNSPRALARLLERTSGVGAFTTRALAGSIAPLGVRTLVHDGDGAVPAGCTVLPVTGRGDARDATDALALLAEAGKSHTPTDRYIIIATSGSTAEPKLVVRAHLAFASLAPPMALGLDPHGEPPERVLMAAGLVHGIGQANLAFGLYMAGELACPRAIEADVTLAEVRSLDPTYVYCSPRVANTLAQQFEAERAAGGSYPTILGPSCRTLRLGGGPSTAQARQVFADQGVDVGEVYSSSETGSIAITPRGDTRMRVLPDVTVTTGPDQELLVRTARGMDGYHGAPELTRAAYTEDGFYRTGDRGVVEDGYLRFLARKHEAFNTPTGDNINPVWIEGLIEVLPWVAQVVLVGDRRPYVTALIVVAAPPDAGDAPDGRLAPEAHPALHATARRDLAAINERLETIEQIRGFVLFARPFPDGMYRSGATMKTRRDRPGIDAAYATHIAELYEPRKGVTMASYKLHCFCQSGNSFKVANYLNCAGLPWQPVLVDYLHGQSRDPGWRKEHNEMGEAPVLELEDGTMLTQSGAILTYLAEKTGKFAPKNEAERWEALRWILFDNHKFTGVFMNVRFQHAFVKDDSHPALMTYLRSRFDRGLAIVEGHLAKSPFIIGEQPTIADFSLTGYLFYPGNESGYDWAKVAPHTHAWIERMRALPGFKEPYDTMPGERIPSLR